MAATVAVATVTGAVLVAAETQRPAQGAVRPRTGTEPVQRRTLTAVVAQAGTLTYRAGPDRAPYSVIDQARGIYTELPAIGRVVRQGRVLYRVDDRPVVLLYGSTPAYRSLSAGATGPDVAELNADLIALGYGRSAQLRPRSSWFGPATADALEKLQAAVGMSRTGRLGVGQVVFEPTAVRVTSVIAAPGGNAQPGQAVVQATSTTREVQVALSASQQSEMAVGDRVTIALPDNRSTPGVVTSVGSVATCPSSAGPGGAGAAPAGADACGSGGSTGGGPTIAVDVTPSHPSATGRWDEAPVQVDITTATVRDALVVPVTALLAQAGGGYALEIAGTAAAHRLVPVSLGLFDDADGLVQVTGPGLAAGENVVVPAT